MDDQTAHRIARLRNEIQKHERLCNRCWQGLWCATKHRMRIEIGSLERGEVPLASLVAMQHNDDKVA